jgi:O-6-methylguanine DNA methyltransferase
MNRPSQEFRLQVPTADGEFVASYSQHGLCSLCFPGRPVKVPAERQRLPEQVKQWHALTTKALEDALQGRAPAELPPLDISSGTQFQQEVWRAMCQITVGDTWSYGRIARAIGKPKAVRAVGGACGANPIPVFVPCHRVVAAGNALGGFSAPMDWKRKLLTREGARVRGL